MDIPDFVPNLSELIDINTQWSSRCHWHNKPKKNKAIEQCGNVILVDDIKRRETLMNILRNLISASSTEASNASRTTRLNSSPKIKKTLKDLSELFLCKRWHRVKSGAIYAKWLIELEELKKLTFKLLRHDVRKVLSIEDDKTLSCQGKNLDGTRCGNRISTRSRESANDKIEDVANTHISSPIPRENLKVVAGLLMCQRYHQDQALQKAEEWFKRIQEHYPLANDSSVEQPIPKQLSSEPQTPTTPPPSTPVFRRPSLRDCNSPESDLSSDWSRDSSVAASTPASSPPSKQRYDLADAPPDSSPQSRRRTATKNDIFVAQQPVEKVTGSGPISPDLDLFAFEPLSIKKSNLVIKSSNKLYKKVEGTITSNEESNGYVYAFKREGEKYIKIGYTTKEVKTRIRKWERDCRQQVVVLVEERLPHAGKIERLVHLSLHHDRRREIKCNGGKGCRKQHIEWFEVTLEHAKNVIGLWKYWIDTEPFDETGSLKSTLFKRIEQIRMAKTTPSLDPWQGFMKTVILITSTTVEIKSEIVDNGDNGSTVVKAEATVETKLEAVETDSIAVKADAKVDKANKKDKVEVKIKDELDITGLNHNYHRRIKSEAKRHSGNLTVLPSLPQLDDPFSDRVVPPIAA